MEPLIHRFRNNAKAIPIGNRAWQDAADHGLLGIRARAASEDRLVTPSGRAFVNLSSCAYLGLQSHPALLEGAIAALRRERVIATSMSRLRVQDYLLGEAEEGLSALWGARTVVAHSASSATTGVLPLIASGHLADDGEPRAMVFDQHCHFSMNLIKPICADESEVLVAPHNDLDFVEDACKRHRRVAYVADGAYSTGGSTVVDGLLALQDRYGLFLFFDDSHSLSIRGERGEGLVRSRLGPEMSPLTVVVVSLNKAFGSGGGAILLGSPRHEAVLCRFGGPLAWSQMPGIATLGACLASIDLHRSPELARLQARLAANVELFDQLLPTAEGGNGLNIRLVPVGEEEDAVACSGRILERGYYTSAVFFPIVARGRAGLRVMLRADNRPQDVTEFCAVVREATRRAAGAREHRKGVHPTTAVAATADGRERTEPWNR
jgi:7-keto-8-aminopelargonate synthetase-like enzyme